MNRSGMRSAQPVMGQWFANGKGSAMDKSSESGKVKPMILLWALGIPIPIILLLLLFRGC